jgi:AcrR family transcriptional regulator
MSYKDRKTREKESIRNRIIDEARKIAQNEGWQSVTIPRIADAIEYTPPIVYEYFSSKEGLFKEMTYLGFSLLRVEFEKAVANSETTKERMKMLSLAHWDFAAKNIDLYQLMFSLERMVTFEELSEDMIFNFNIIKATLNELGYNNEEIEKETVTYWMCLMQGAISSIKFMPFIEEQNIEPRDAYIKIIERFIKSI